MFKIIMYSILLAETLEEEILEEHETSDRVAALNLPLLKTAEDVEDPADDEFNLDTFALVYDKLNILLDINMN